MKKNNLFLVKKIVCFIILVSVYILYPLRINADELCLGENATLDCLAKNFDKLYSVNYSLFWNILHKSEKKVQLCSSKSDVVQFMQLIRLKSNNAEFNEFFSEIIENLCIKNSKCFFEVLLQLRKEDMTGIIEIVKNPIFVDKTAISNVFKSNKNNEKYKKIVEQYLDKR